MQTIIQIHLKKTSQLLLSTINYKISSDYKKNHRLLTMILKKLFQLKLFYAKTNIPIVPA